MMDPDVALFAHVVEAGSLSAAARARGISPAMVSKRIARLEVRLGVQLLHRTTRRLETTARGELFYRDVTAILSAIGVAEARVSDRDLTPQGALRVSAPTSFGRLHIAPRLKPFLDDFPLIELELLLSDDFVDVARDGIDLAIPSRRPWRPNSKRTGWATAGACCARPRRISPRLACRHRSPRSPGTACSPPRASCHGA
jgi:DNA-binding transcriptional LysR family regulator